MPVPFHSNAQAIVSQFGGGEVPTRLMMTSMAVFETPFATVNCAPPIHNFPYFRSRAII